MGRFLSTLLLAAVCTSSLVAQDVSDRDQRVAQVLLNVTNLRELAAPDDRTALGYKRACADDTGNTYCHQVRNLTDDGGRKHAWSLRVAYSPGGWEDSGGPEPVSTDPDGSEFFVLPSRDAKQGTTRVAARLTVGDLRLTLQDSRSGDLAQGEHLRLMKNRWSFLLEQAVKHKLIEQSDEPRIYVTLGETEWFGAARELVDGDVVSVDEDLARWAVFPLSVFVDPPPVTEDKTEYVIDLDVDAEGLRETRITYANGKPVHFRESVDTYQLVIDTEQAPTAELLVRFKPLVLTEDSPLGQKAVLSFSARTVKVGTTITLHRTTWFPTLRRFELDQEYLLRDPGQEDPQPTTSPEVQTDPMLDQTWRFNSARIAAADAVGAWRQLAPLVAIRPGVDEDSPGGRAPGPTSPVFRPNEPVVLGFKLDERVGAGYWHAENVAGAEHTMTPWVENVPQKVYVDLWLDRDPEPPPTTWADVMRGIEDEFEDLFGPEPEAPDEASPTETRDTSPQLSQLERQRKLRQEVFVDEFEFYVARISDESLGWTDKTAPEVRAPIERRLSEWLRQPAGLENWRRSFGTRLNSREPIERYAFALPLGNLKNGRKEDGLRWIPRGAGLYELRLVLELSSGDGSRKERVAAAIRVNVVGSHFKAELFHKASRRGR